MKTFIHNGHTIELYTGIDELPVTRFQAYNRFLLVDAGIGSDLNDVDRHIGVIRQFIGKGDKVNADKELMNLRQNIAFIVEGVSPAMMAFVPLIYKLDGEQISDLSDEGVKRVIALLGEKRISLGVIRLFFQEVKKNWKANWRSFTRKPRTVQS